MKMAAISSGGPGVCADLVRPARPMGIVAYELMLLAAGSALLALSARLVIVLPNSAVPVTAQTFAVLLIGALYGWRRGAATVVLYMTQGVCGLPVFAAGGAGVVHLLGPTGGYLLGFIPAVIVVGALADRGWDRRWIGAAGAMTLGTLVIFACGLAYLAAFVPANRLAGVGLLPYLPGAVLKIAAATALLPMGWRVLGWLRRQ